MNKYSMFQNYQEFLDSWNYQHIGALQLDIDRNSHMANWCELVIIEAKKAYYSGSKELFPDEVYDSIEDRLKALRPESFVLRMVGTKFPFPDIDYDKAIKRMMKDATFTEIDHDE